MLGTRTVPATAAPAAVFRVKVEAVIVVGSITRLKAATTLLLMATLLAPFVGPTEVTVGAGGPATVVNVHVKADASAVPAALFAPVLIVAV
jgi:hypothetical protein